MVFIHGLKVPQWSACETLLDFKHAIADHVARFIRYKAAIYIRDTEMSKITERITKVDAIQRCREFDEQCPAVQGLFQEFRNTAKYLDLDNTQSSAEFDRAGLLVSIHRILGDEGKSIKDDKSLYEVIATATPKLCTSNLPVSYEIVCARHLCSHINRLATN